jgi:Spy/CpxP family protein refolding chaperone
MGDRMKRWKLWIGISLIFMLGAGLGSLGTGYVLKDQREHRFFHTPAGRTGFIVERLTRKLDLTQTQKAEIETIVQKMQEKSRPRFQSHREEMRSILNEGLAEIRKKLTPEQQEKMDRLHQEFERNRMMRESRWDEK